MQVSVCLRERFSAKLKKQVKVELCRIDVDEDITKGRLDITDLRGKLSVETHDVLYRAKVHVNRSSPESEDLNGRNEERKKLNKKVTRRIEVLGPLVSLPPFRMKESCNEIEELLMKAEMMNEESYGVTAEVFTEGQIIDLTIFKKISFCTSSNISHCSTCGKDYINGDTSITYLDEFESKTYCTSCDRKHNSDRKLPISHVHGKLAKSLVRDNLSDTIRNFFMNYSSRPFIGIKENLSLELIGNLHCKLGYYWFTFSQIWKFICSLNEYLNSCLMDTSMISFLLPNSIYWIVLDLLCQLSHRISCPFDIQYDDSILCYLLEHTKSTICFTNEKYYPTLLSAYLKLPEESKYLKSVISVDRFPNDSSCVDFNCFTLSDILHKYSSDNFVPKFEKQEKDPISMLMFTSGSTSGIPKALIKKESDTFKLFSNFKPPYKGIRLQLVFTPLSHLLGRNTLYRSLMIGQPLAIYSSSFTDIFTEFVNIQPTKIASIPQLWNNLYLNFQHQLQQLSGYSNDTKYNCTEEIYNIWFSFEKVIGSRVDIIATGSAPTSTETCWFLKNVFPRCSVKDGYGTSEVGQITSNYYLSKSNSVQIRLIDCPELGYLSTDSPYPRGEILVSTKKITKSGYFKNIEKTIESYTNDGYFITGDIGIFIPNKNLLFVIDRKSFIFKLSFGEKISPQYYENILLTASPFIQQLWITGLSSESFVIGVIVPNYESVYQQMKKLDKRKFKNLSLEQLIQYKETNEFILQHIQNIGIKLNLPGYCIPKIIILSAEEFTNENNLLTSTGKINRRKLQQKYKQEIIEIYKGMKSKTLSNILSSFNTSQLDSLAAVQLSNQIRASLNYHVSPTDILSKGIESIPDIITNSNLENTKLVEQDLNWNISNINHSNLMNLISKVKIVNQPNIILITGSTGFLGAHVLNEILLSNNLRESNMKVYCLVRCKSIKNHHKNKDVFLQKLDKWKIGYDHLVGDSKYLWKQNFENCTEIIWGDIELEYLGWELNDFIQFSIQVKHIIHIAACVNWLIPYEEIRIANVFGTQQLIYMSAIHQYYKNHHNIEWNSPRFSFISTMGVLDSTVNEHLEKENIINGYKKNKTAYSISKAVAEYLVRTHCEQLNIILDIFRPGLISGSRETGICNSNDYLTRLLQGVQYMGKGFLHSKYFDFIPVDDIAKFIINISKNTMKYGVYNIFQSNPLTYSQFFKWYQEFNPNIKLIEYEEWRDNLLKQYNEKANMLTALVPFFKERGPLGRDKSRKENSHIISDISKSLLFLYFKTNCIL